MDKFPDINILDKINSHKNLLDKINANRAEDQKIILGIKDGKLESKEQLKQRLKAIKTMSPFSCPGAMCYSTFIDPRTVEEEHICPHCGRNLKVVRSPKQEPLSKLQETISNIISEIKNIGYDIYVEHMCGECFKEKYGYIPIHKRYSFEIERAVSVEEDYLEHSNTISVLFFKFPDSENYTMNIVSLDD